MHFCGLLYRALNPIYASQPLSGQGAANYGGRFNPKGVPALYTSLSVLTALREANQVGNLQPTTLVAYDADLADVFDTRDVKALQRHGMTPETLADASWRDQMQRHGIAPTQAFARDLITSGSHGLLVRSFAAGAGPDELNLVIWRWSNVLLAKLSVIDDQGRLIPRP